MHGTMWQFASLGAAAASKGSSTTYSGKGGRTFTSMPTAAQLAWDTSLPRVPFPQGVILIHHVVILRE